MHDTYKFISIFLLCRACFIIYLTKIFLLFLLCFTYVIALLQICQSCLPCWVKLRIVYKAIGHIFKKRKLVLLPPCPGWNLYIQNTTLFFKFQSHLPKKYKNMNWNILKEIFIKLKTSILIFLNFYCSNLKLLGCHTKVL